MTFAELTASCLCRAELAQPPSSANQSKLKLNPCWKAPHSFISYYTGLPVQGSLCDKGKRVLENRLGLLLVTLKQPRLCQHGWEGSVVEDHRQPATAVWDADGCRLDPSLMTNTDKSLQIYGPTLIHLMTLLISVGVSGQTDFGALRFSSSAFQIQVFLWLVPHQAPARWHRLPTALLGEPSIFKS